ncbi:MAG: chorismate synthase [Sandaracinaceae bacterium]|nr:chorismate synthase [Sandaracinaceae bacterium]
MPLRFLTAGESHGAQLTGILEGVPAGLALAAGDFDPDLAMRQRGYGRSPRMKIEQDRVAILSGVRHGRTTGGPISLSIENRDFANWTEVMSVAAAAAQPHAVTRPRPGHADLPGALKYGHSDIRDVIERASARETAMRVALGVVGRRMLHECGVEVGAHVVAVGGVTAPSVEGEPWEVWRARAQADDLRCADAIASEKMRHAIRDAAHVGDTLGGVFEVRARAMVVGLGSYVHWDRRLDARLAAALMSVPAIKGVEVGDGFDSARKLGSEVHDVITEGKDSAAPFVRETNRAGGVEGGVSNGEPLVCRAAMKPLSTLKKALPTVDIATRANAVAVSERSDVCAVAAASVVGEAVVCLCLADALLEKFGGDSMRELCERVVAWRGNALNR